MVSEHKPENSYGNPKNGLSALAFRDQVRNAVTGPLQALRVGSKKERIVPGTASRLNCDDLPLTSTE
jgi:hypothetical protein